MRIYVVFSFGDTPAIPGLLLALCLGTTLVVFVIRKHAGDGAQASRMNLSFKMNAFVFGDMCKDWTV